MADTRRPLPWNASQHEPDKTGCLKMYDTGIFDIKVDTYGANGVNDTCAAPNVTGDPACEYTACYTTRGERCVFPFLHEWENGTMIQYTTCAGIDVHRPWCATETDPSNNNAVLRWGLCLPDCPTIEPEVACLEDPIFPEWVRPQEKGRLSYDVRKIH